MNKISKNLRGWVALLENTERRVTISPIQLADELAFATGAIERLVEAAEELNRHNLYECPCIQMDGTWKEFSDSLAAFREEQT